MVRLFDERDKSFEIVGLEEIKKYLGEEFDECEDAFDINDLLIANNGGLAGYRCEEIDDDVELNTVNTSGLKELRINAGLSQSELGAKSGVSVRMIQHYEQGVKDINKAQGITLKHLADALGCSMEDLIIEEEIVMNEEMKTRILMMDGCTKDEALKHLKRGTIIYEDFDSRFENYMEEWNIEEDSIEEYRNMVDTGVPVLDWGVVSLNGKAYYIQYCL